MNMQAYWPIFMSACEDDYSFLDEYASILVVFLDENVCILVKLIRNSKSFLLVEGCSFFLMNKKLDECVHYLQL